MIFKLVIWFMRSNTQKYSHLKVLYIKTYIGKIFYHCHFVKKHFFVFLNKLRHVYSQCVYIVKAKYQILLSKVVVGVVWPMKALSEHILRPYLEKLSEFSCCHFVKIQFFNETPSCTCSMCLHYEE